MATKLRSPIELMEKLYVNQIGPDGELSTVGLFYSQAEAEKIVVMLRDIPERATFRYEIVPAVRHLLAEKGAPRTQTPTEEGRCSTLTTSSKKFL